MVVICCCQCDPRLATYAIAVITFLHFGTQTALVISQNENHSYVAEDDGIKYYTVLATHLFVMLAAIFLFLAAYTLKIVLCLPWLLGCAFTLLLYAAVFVLILIRIVSGGDLVNLETALFILFWMASIAYAMWIVVMFTLEVKAHTYDEDHKHGKSKSKATLYDEVDYSNTDDDVFANKKGNGGKDKKKKRRNDDRTPLIHNHP